MTKELQDHVWSILPKEFKEEVKKEYEHQLSIDNEQAYWMLERIFSKHNLTSDAEGEEMLTVSRKRVQELYDFLQSEQERKDLELHNQVSAEDRAAMLFDLFGSKCLPDETCNIASKDLNPAEEDDVFNDPEPKCLHFKDGKCAHPAVAHLENGKLVKGADCDVSSCEDVEYEPNPAEPKFKEGDRAIYCIPEKQRIKARVVNVRQRSGSTLFNTLFNYDIRLDDGRTANWVDEQWLLPDNDDQVRAVTEKASERFDKILAKDLRKEKRLRIAAQITASIYANHKAASRFHSIDALVRKALEIADALIAECEKGGTQD